MGMSTSIYLLPWEDGD